MEIIVNKLNQVIEAAYEKWCDSIVRNEIPTTNEITIQVYLAYIILKELESFECDNKYRIKVILEEDAGEQHSSKTDGRARCDIMVKAQGINKPNKEYVAAIEMKCLKKREVGKRNKPMTQMRLSVLQDIENLEKYSADLKFEIVYSNDRSYPHPTKKDVKNNIGSGVKIDCNHINDLTGKLKNEYTIIWDENTNAEIEHFFLKLKVK